MEHDNQALYEALASKDPRFDGRVFVGVSSTGIYCRPVCRAKLPKRENCTFFNTAAEAEQAGYRPCLLCRPERAPGRAPVDAVSSLAHRAARLLEEECASTQSIERVAARLGYTGRHLRRAFEAEYHVSPVQYLQTCRLLLAKGLLTDTSLTVAQVAQAAGFGSTRRFNDLFKGHYRLTPTQLRKHTAPAAGEGGLTLALGYRPPYPWEQMLDFLGTRAITGVEAVHNGAYLRTVRLPAPAGRVPAEAADDSQGKGSDDEYFGWLRVSNMPQKQQLAVTVSESLLPALPLVLGRVKLLFDTACDPVAVYEGLAAMDEIRPGLRVLGTRVPGSFDVFEMAVRAVLGQQVTVKAAGTLAARIVNAYGTALDTGIQGLTHCFPAPDNLLALGPALEEHLGPLGVTGARARTIKTLALALTRAQTSANPAPCLDLSISAQPEEQIARLVSLPGIGPWTAHYIAMRALAWPDAFLETDYGVKKALEPRTPREILALAQAWRPWRSYATLNLWNSLY